MNFCRKCNLFSNCVNIIFHFIILLVDFLAVVGDFFQKGFCGNPGQPGDSAKTQLTEQQRSALIVVLLILPTHITLHSAGTGHLCQQQSLLFTFIHLSSRWPGVDNYSSCYYLLCNFIMSKFGFLKHSFSGAQG